MKRKSLKVNSILSGCKTVFSIIFPLITYPYVSRVLQVDNIGKVSFSNSVISYFTLLAGLGISTYATREGARLRDNERDLNSFANEVFSFNLLTTVFAYILLFLTIAIVPQLHNYVPILLIQSLSLIGTTISISWFYTLKEDYLYITLRSLFINIVSLILMFLLVKDSSDYLIYVAITVLSNVGANIINFLHAKKYIKIQIIRHINLRQHIKPVMVIFASSVATIIYVNSDSTMLGFMSGNYYVGLYSTAGNIYFIMKSLISSMILVALPRLSNYIATDRWDEYKNTVNSILKSVLVFVFPVIIGLFVTSPAIITIIAGDTYADAVPALQILSLSLLFAVLSTFFTNAVLLPMKREKVFLKVTVTSAIINIVLNIFMIRYFNQNGAAITTAVAELYVCIMQYLDVRERVDLKMEKKFMAGILYGCVAICIISYIVNLLWQGVIFNTLVKVFLSVIVYGGILIVFKNSVILNYIKQVKILRTY